MRRGRRWAVGAWAVLTVLGAGLTLWLQQAPAPAEGTPRGPEPYGKPYGSPPPQPESDGCASPPAPQVTGVIRDCAYTFTAVEGATRAP
ncbi:hypothetical protein [Streptomyces sp. NPDC050504]|uniref:hypothetical protein n=1 Tax=Streptomyces sp. NPDC050504 TaxID=3365618 RepID=UPI0037B44ED7